MEYNKELYEKLRNEYVEYQLNTESKIKKLTDENIKLEKDMDVLTNIIQISQYINSCIREKNLVCMINDMIVGVLGVKHSAIYIVENGKLEIKANNSEFCNIEINEQEQRCINEGREYLVNSDTYIKICPICNTRIKSSMGMPINLRGKFIGYITVDHTINLTEENRIFLTSISAQIAIALENSMLYRELSNLAKLDPLMGIYNRKYFFQKVEEIVRRNKEMPYAIVMIDLDNFKKVNDTFGHQYGDEVLRNVSRTLSSNLMENSILARYGGEELVIFIDKFKDNLDVFNNIEMIREKIEKTEVVLGDIKSHVTASIGIAFSKGGEEKIADVINIADGFLYDAKHFGKNRIVWRE